MSTENQYISSLAITSGVYPRIGMILYVAWSLDADTTQNVWLYQGSVCEVDDTTGIVSVQVSASESSPMANSSPPWFIDAPEGGFDWRSGSALDPSTFTHGQFCLVTQAATTPS